MGQNVMIYRQDVVELLDREGLLAHSDCGSPDEMNDRTTLYPGSLAFCLPAEI